MEWIAEGKLTKTKGKVWKKVKKMEIGRRKDKKTVARIVRKWKNLEKAYNFS